MLFDSGKFTAMQACHAPIEIKGWLSDVFKLIKKHQRFGIEEFFVVNNIENSDNVWFGE